MEIKDFKLGLYRFYWTDGGSSYVAIRNDNNGEKYFTACNWISGEVKLSEYIKRIKRAVLIRDSNIAYKG